jgi:AraC-like DNA-binding protein
MISFGILSISLLMLVAQSLLLAIILIGSAENRLANRFLAALIFSIASMVTPYIIGFAGFYDAFPWLSFAPFITSLSFGPLLYLHAIALTTQAVPKNWYLHLYPYGIQFLAQALVFPLPLELKNRWDTLAHAPIIDPILDIASFISIGAYGYLVWLLYRSYTRGLAQVRADDAKFDPSWLRNAVFSVGALGIVWLGFFIADRLDPSRDYFDKYWLYMGIASIGVYLGIAGWRNANLAYPVVAETIDIAEDEANIPNLTANRDWRAMGAQFVLAVDQNRLWLDPDLTLTTLAKKLGTNTTYLSKALNEGAGQSFSAFINQRRVREVQELLKHESKSKDLLAIAFEAGFNSKASFNRAFAEFAGMGPAAWRRNQSLKS